MDMQSFVIAVMGTSRSLEVRSTSLLSSVLVLKTVVIAHDSYASSSDPLAREFSPSTILTVRRSEY